MARALKLYNTYLHSIRDARLSSGHLIKVAQCNEAKFLRANLYICGPTVYSDSHLGHALTYARADLFRKVMKCVFGIRLTTLMNITDIDDKILERAKSELPKEMAKLDARPDHHPFNLIGEKYYKSFISDMDYINVDRPDMNVKVSKQVDLIMNYIQQLEQSGNAYPASNGDIYFSVSSIKNYEGRTDQRQDDLMHPDPVKRDIRDFALWKAAKSGEPSWLYKSPNNDKILPGRPGWHVQCSAICSAIFGRHLDFHFGGKDLIFPHHYNEQACCSAYYKLDTSKCFHVWAQNWLHSGHLMLRNEKMSKSLQNVIRIQDFIGETSVNALRLLCVAFHYRADVTFDEDLLDYMRRLDHKLKAFINFVRDALIDVSNTPLSDVVTLDLGADIDKVHDDIITGICEDLDLAKGLNSILDLSKLVYNIGSANLKPKDLVNIWQLMVDWTSMCALDYGCLRRAQSHEELVDLVRDFRQEIRSSVIQRIRDNKLHTKSAEDEVFFKNLLAKCDNVRSRMNDLGYVSRDIKS